MRPGTSLTDAGEAAWQPLVDRLCDAEAEVVFFPVRHHSPAAAALVSALVDRLRPAAVLIEGPSDYNPHLDELFLGHELPIAIYSYFRDASGEPRGAYYPFSDYSPEWLTLQRARAAGAAVRFIDLPWIAIADDDRTAHRYADAELRRGRYVRAVCERLGVEDFDDLWDKLVESEPRLELADYLRRVHSLCLHVRLWEETIAAADRRREAFMADRLRAAQAEFDGRLVVVTGGFHSAALAARLEGFECPGLEPVEPQGPAAGEPLDRGIALTTYSYERLDSLTGYDAGMPSPGFYDHAWRQRQRGEAFSHAPLLRELVGDLRAKKQVASTADVIAVETMARALAALRGRAHVWRRDLLDAVASSLIKDELEYGCASPFIDAVHAVLRGKRRGRLAEGTRLPPLVVDLQGQLAEAGLALPYGVREVELNLLDPADRAKSRLLHRLRVLGIAGYQRTGGTDFLARDDLARLWEAWRLAWSPEFDATSIEAARYGTTLAEAAANCLLAEAAGEGHSAERTSAILVQAAQAGVEAMSDPLLARIEQLIRQEPDFAGVTRCLGHLLFLYCYDEAFGTAGAPRIGAVLAEAFSRSLWLLESLGQSTAPAAPLVDGMRALLETAERAEGRVDLDRGEFAAVLDRVVGDRGKPPQVRGAAVGMLWTLGRASADAVLGEMLGFSDPEHLGDFLAGLFALAREVAQRHPQLVRAIDRLLLEFTAEEFQHTLPSLRLAFTYFTPREKHYMLTTLFESLGLREVKPLADLAVDAETAAAALALEEKLFAALATCGLVPVSGQPREGGEP